MNPSEFIVMLQAIKDRAGELDNLTGEAIRAIVEFPPLTDREQLLFAIKAIKAIARRERLPEGGQIVRLAEQIESILGKDV